MQLLPLLLLLLLVAQSACSMWQAAWKWDGCIWGGRERERQRESQREWGRESAWKHSPNNFVYGVNIFTLLASGQKEQQQQQWVSQHNQRGRPLIWASAAISLRENKIRSAQLIYLFIYYAWPESSGSSEAFKQLWVLRPRWKLSDVVHPAPFCLPACLPAHHSPTAGYKTNKSSRARTLATFEIQ